MAESNHLIGAKAPRSDAGTPAEQLPPHTLFNKKRGGLNPSAPFNACLLLQVRIHPPIHRLVPQPAILWLQNPVTLIGEIEHLRGNLQPLQVGEKFKSLRDVETIIE